MDKDRAFSQGARCGHIEGKGRAGQYVIGEEVEPSFDAASGQPIDVTGSDVVYFAWARGYQHGYKLAAEGSELEAEHATL